MRLSALELRRHLERDTSVIVGAYDEVAEVVRAFAAGHGTEEVMFVSYIADLETKVSQYRELAVRLAD